MTHPPERKPVPIQLAACCPEAQADGVPCSELGRDCEVCERAVAMPGSAPPEEDQDGRADPWAV
jgi:hypothetical protein